MAITRQSIVSAIETRMKAILTTGGYHTNLGSHVFVNRPRLIAADGSIGSVMVEASELPCVVVSDPQDEISPETFSTDKHRLTVELEIRAEGGADCAVDMRQMIADVYKAIGSDTTWGALAVNTLPGSDETVILQGDKIVGATLIKIVVEFNTPSWTE